MRRYLLCRQQEKAEPGELRFWLPIMINKKDGEDLADFLDENVFKGNEGSTLAPEAEGVKGFDAFMDRYMKGLGIERAAVESRIW